MLHTTPSDPRPSPLAGLWYPGQADRLRAMIEGFLEHPAPAAPGGEVQGLLAPHAGYRYSGPVAAHAFSAVAGQHFETVVIAGPLHHRLSGLPRAARLLTTDHDAYATPLGTVSIDHDALARVGTALGASLPLIPIRDDPEHSIEIEIPFLQAVLRPGFRIVPIMLIDQSQPTAAALGAALAEALRDRQALFVASSDLSHFYPQAEANALDLKMLACVADMDAPRVIAYDEGGVAFACGHGAIAAVIHALQALGQPQANIVRYATSGDVTGDFSRVVGYGAATFQGA
jgi:AmmeMemoRadiSam system protein B